MKNINPQNITVQSVKTITHKNTLQRKLRPYTKNWGLYLLALPMMAFLIIFSYIPMYGVLIAFQKYNPVSGILGSEWVGLTHFINFFTSYNFGPIMRNTLVLSIYSLIAGFPIPIILALLLNSCSSTKMKKIVQTTSYAPYFISTVVVVGMLMVFLSPSTGIVNKILNIFGVESKLFMGDAKLFSHVYVWSGVWQSMGWSSIIYIATLAGVNTELYEAAIVDGASKLQRIRYIDIPSIVPTTVILLILNMGSILSVGFEKVFLMQNSLNKETSEIISTYVYQIGLIRSDFSYSTAIGLFNSLVNILLLLIVNYASKKLSETSLW